MTTGTASSTHESATDVRTTFSLALLRAIVPGLSSTWVSEQEARGERVARYRRYVDGDHDIPLTAEMRRLLKIARPEDGLNLNFMDVVVQTMADRCKLQTIEAIEEDQAEGTHAEQTTTTANQADPFAPVEPVEKKASSPQNDPNDWVQEVLDYNRIDALQGEVHEGAIRDGDSYIMESYDEESQRARFTLEEAFDGESGMLMFYPSKSVAQPECAIKIWQITEGEALITRVNVYYADRLEKYISTGGALTRYEKDPGGEWTDRQGNPLGIPVHHFRNGGRANYGRSELRNVISPQNALNSFNHTAVGAALYTAFSPIVTRGFQLASLGISPGAVIPIHPEAPLTRDEVADVTRLAAGDLTQIVSMLHLMRASIADISQTPAPQFMGNDASSGESLKQREVGLIGKVQRFMVRAGNSWEDVIDSAWKIEETFAPTPPPNYRRCVAKWRSPELRDDEKVVKNALAMRDLVGDKQTLRFVAPVYDLDEQSIDEIMDEKHGQDAERIAAIGATLPTFNNFQPIPDQQDQGQPMDMNNAR